MKILVVDDERSQREALAGFLESIDYEVALADSAQTALAYLHKNSVDVVLTDFKMPYMTGNDLLKEIRRRYPTMVVLIMTAFGTVETAVEAMKAGAWDFVTKPVDLDQLEQQLQAIDKYRSQHSGTAEIAELPDTGFITADENMQALLEKARRVAGKSTTILVTGETGTGKEELARYIHQHSARADRKMLAVNCAALPANLVESELFGHVKGAFTGATGDRKGYFETADKSTLFLDEIGDLPLDIQVKLLRFLQNGEFQPVGSDKMKVSNVRIIAATNVNLQLAVEQKEFREDLYYRLDVIRFHIPPLRKRPDDIRIMTEAFLREFATAHQSAARELSPAAVEKLQAYAFPGNVRELRNIIERAVVLTEGDSIQADDLEVRSAGTPAAGDLNTSVEQLERDLISRTLAESSGNQSESARRLGISERVLRYKLQKYNLR